jgi:hypothetical protein
MIILFGMLGYLILGGAIAFLAKRLSKAKETLFATRRQVVHAQASLDAARKAARTAEQRCIQALRNVEMSLTQAGQAMEVAGHIQVVSEQIHYLTEAIAGPPEEAYEGRHAMPGSTVPAAISDGTQDTEYAQAEYPQEEYAS